MNPDALLAELEALGPGGLEALLSGRAAREHSPGEQVEGVVVRVTDDVVFVDIGGKSEAILERIELEAGELPVPGDPIRGVVLSAGERGVRLARRLSGRGGRDILEQAQAAGIPIEGRVESRNSGGYVVRVAGQSGFCPASQIDHGSSADPDSYIGQTLLFEIVDLNSRDVVVSRRNLQAEASKAAAAALWDTLGPGDVKEGVVSSVKDYGVFVDIGGVDGLVHRSEIGWDDNATPPARGDRVRVHVIEVDRAAGRVSLSMKDPSVGPWSRVGTEIVEGNVVSGKVARLTAFGAFVSLGGGLDGLIHISNLADRRVEHPSEVVRTGQEVRVRVLGIDADRQRLDLGLKQAGEEAGEESWEPTGRAPVKAAATGSFGTMADLLSGLKVRR